ncbi:MAG: ComF family protein [Alphaproteobacteria bacterium]|nr:ComF family protein [Alphaproteobacteria bacterium]MDX5369508.1 ComF family protein [Alphaproteobacteria bacterium]MDX5464166.1 ComF family protein [Alphaproteobacteria bacterium]
MSGGPHADRAAVPGSGPMLAALRGLLDIALPPTCAGCGTVVSAPHALCPACWGRVRFVTAPMCAACGVPFEVEAAPGALCAACAADRPRIAVLRAATHYADPVRQVLLGFKHGDRLEHAPLLARWLCGAGGDALEGAEVIVPVPLHWRRLVRRRYNQSALLAQALGRATGIPVEVAALRRTRATPMQRGQSRTGRRRNVAGAFDVAPRARPRIAGRTVLLVDDVVTTGATLEACARALLKGGAARVHALAVARVVPDAGNAYIIAP